jgi:hypothetical protein
MQCALQLAATCPHPGKCDYHAFLAQAQLRGHDAGDLPFPEIRRCLAVYPPDMRSSAGSAKAVSLIAAGQLVVNTTKTTAGSPLQVARQRVTRFLRLLDHLGTAPWANLHFEVNHRILLRLTAAHLGIIAPGAPQTLCHLIDPRNTLEGAQNLVWVTNRQQGKTTTLARFLAALAIACPLGGLVATVYSTSLDRSIELVKAAKKYIYWLNTDAGRFPEYRVDLMRDNDRMFAINNGVAVNEVIARPKNPDSCRGDAPRAAIFDEVGFIGQKLWKEFAFPLLQVGGRVFTCATTPPPPTGFFSAFIAQVKAQNAVGDHFFQLINHSLTCAACLDAGNATECCHNLMYLPPWKSLVTLNQMLSLVADKETYQMEVYGILSGAGKEYLPLRLLNAAAERERVYTPFFPDFVWIAIDPASHGVSDFAGIAFAMTPVGVHVVVGMFNINMNRCQTSEVQMVLHQFAERVRAHPLIHAACTLVPIIECNNNEILAMSMLRVFETYGPVYVPWESTRFDIGISHGIGVWMTHDNKMAAIQCTYQAFLDGRVSFAEELVVADRTAFAPRSESTDPAVLVAKLVRQLSVFQDQQDGTVSGKHVGNDDLACAFLLGVYWSLSARASFMEAGR